MQFSITFAIVALSAVVSAGVAQPPTSNVNNLVARQNAGRPVPNGLCCAENRSLKQDVCNVRGQRGRCVPDFINGCKLPDLFDILHDANQTHRWHSLDLHSRQSAPVQPCYPGAWKASLPPPRTALGLVDTQRLSSKWAPISTSTSSTKFGGPVVV